MIFLFSLKKSLYDFLLGLPSDDELFKFLLISKILLTLQFWIKTLLGRVFLVWCFFLFFFLYFSPLWVYHVTPFSSVPFSRSVVSDSLWPHESQHARPPCPSPTPGVHSNSRPLSRWCHPAISSSVVPFYSCPLTLPVSEMFPMSQLFTWGGQSTGVSTLTSFLPKKSQDWSLEWSGWISLHSKGLSRVFSNTTVLCTVLCIYNCIGTYRFLSPPFTFLFNYQIHFVSKAVHVPDLKG